MYGWSNRNKRHLIMKRHSGAKSLMVLWAIILNVKCELIIIDSRINSQKYVGVLENDLLSILSQEALFQQDNCPIYLVP